MDNIILNKTIYNPTSNQKTIKLIIYKNNKKIENFEIFNDFNF